MIIANAMHQNNGKIIEEEKNQLKIRRVFLEEYNKDGTFKKHRPLGVPDVRWRVILAMYGMYLVNLYHAEWNVNQYACMPKVGVVDAWMKILTIVEERRNIVGKFGRCVVYKSWVCLCVLS